MVNLNNLRSSRGNGQNSPSMGKNNRNLMQIVEEILNKPSLTTSAETVRREIVQFFRESEREGVETSSFKLSLLDPLSRKRIRIPVRSVECDHFQCFDLHNFLEINYRNKGDENGRAWHCPHCQVEAKEEQLRVDGYFQEILLKVGSEPLEVEIFPDGQWKELEQIDFKDIFPVGKDDDDVVEIVRKKKSRILEEMAESTTSPGNGAAPLPGCVRCEETRQLLGLSPGENFVEAMQKLKLKSETVDSLCEILGIELNNGGEKAQMALLVETVQKLMEKKKETTDFETTNQLEKVVENSPEDNGTMAPQLTHKQKQSLRKKRQKYAKRKEIEASTEKVPKGKNHFLFTSSGSASPVGPSELDLNLVQLAPKQKSVLLRSWLQGATRMRAETSVAADASLEKEAKEKTDTQRQKPIAPGLPFRSPSSLKLPLKPVDANAYQLVQETLSLNADVRQVLDSPRIRPDKKIFIVNFLLEKLGYLPLPRQDSSKKRANSSPPSSASTLAADKEAKKQRKDDEMEENEAKEESLKETTFWSRHFAQIAPDSTVWRCLAPNCEFATDRGGPNNYVPSTVECAEHLRQKHPEAYAKRWLFVPTTAVEEEEEESSQKTLMTNRSDNAAQRPVRRRRRKTIQKVRKSIRGDR